MTKDEMRRVRDTADATTELRVKGATGAESLVQLVGLVEVVEVRVSGVREYEFEGSENRADVRTVVILNLVRGLASIGVAAFGR